MAPSKFSLTALLLGLWWIAICVAWVRHLAFPFQVPVPLLWHHTLAPGLQACAIAVSPDGRTVAVSSGQGEHIRLLDAQTGQDTWSARSVAHALAFSPNGRYLATVEHQGPLKVIDLKTWQTVLCSPVGQLSSVPVPTKPNHTAVAFSPDSQWVVAASPGGYIRQVKLSSGESWPLLGNQEPVNALAVSPDGRHLATAGRRELLIWDMSTGKLVSRRRLHGPLPHRRALAFTPDGQRVALIAGPDQVAIYDLQSLRPAKTQTYPVGRASALAISPDGQTLATGSPLCLWNCSTGRLRTATKTPFDRVTDLAFSPDGQLLIGCLDVGPQDGVPSLLGKPTNRSGDLAGRFSGEIAAWKISELTPGYVELRDWPIGWLGVQTLAWLVVWVCVARWRWRKQKFVLKKPSLAMG